MMCPADRAMPRYWLWKYRILGLYGFNFHCKWLQRDTQDMNYDAISLQNGKDV